MKSRHDCETDGSRDTARFPTEGTDLKDVPPEARATNPDLLAAAAVEQRRLEAATARRKKLEEAIAKPSKGARRQEVINRILLNESIDETELDNIRISSNEGSDHFMEFRLAKCPIITYVYYEPSYKNPSYLTATRASMPLRHAGATVLLRINTRHLQITEVYRWPDEE